MLTTCKTWPSAIKPPKPIDPKLLQISWHQEANGRLSISLEDAVKLEQWLIDVQFYLDHS